MKYNNWLFLILFLSTTSFAGSLTCSSSDGALRYTSKSYSGGAAPAPGMLLHQKRWYFGQNIIFEESNYMNCDFSENCEAERPINIESNINWLETPGSKQVLQEYGGQEQYYHRVIYGVKILLFSNVPGQVMTGLNVENVESWFICNETQTFYP